MKRIAVIGDIIVDRFRYLRSLKLLPEGGIPVATSIMEEAALGGAGNVALSLKNLGFIVDLFYPLSDQSRLVNLVAQQDADAITFIPLATKLAKLPSIKTRYYLDNLHFLREDDEPFDAHVADVDYSPLLTSLGQYSAIVISDYRKGCFDSHSLQATLIAISKQKIPSFLDTKSSDLRLLRSAFCLKVNLTEFKALASSDFDVSGCEIDDIRALMLQVCQLHDVAHLVVTLGPKGSLYVNSFGDSVYSPALPTEPIDVTGAGDAYLAALLYDYFFGVKGDPGIREVHRFGSSSLTFANAAAASVIVKRGTVPVASEFLVSNAKKTSQHLRVGFTNGCFDLLHIGHVRLLEFARAQCDYLVVGINSDSSVRRLKGESRPIYSEQDRKELLLSLRIVDEVHVFHQDTPLDLIMTIKPHVLVKGSDYEIPDIAGADFVLANGGEVLRFNLVPGRGTTLTIERINAGS